MLYFYRTKNGLVKIMQTQEIDMFPTEMSEDFDILSLLEWRVEDGVYKDRRRFWECVHSLGSSCSSRIDTVSSQDVELALGRWENSYQVLTSLDYSIQHLESSVKISKWADLYNYLDDVYGEAGVEIIEKLQSLSVKCYKFLQSLSSISGREGRLEYVRANIKDVGIESGAYEFLPGWIRDDLRYFGIDDIWTPLMITNQKNNGPEYNREGHLDSNLDVLENMEAYVRDELWKVILPGMNLGADEIKDIVGKVYLRLGIKKTPKITDLDPYFVLSRNWNKTYRVMERRFPYT